MDQCCCRGGNVGLCELLTELSVQAGWTKGKLSCPGCGARLGGFDYVTRASLPVYIVRSKVDLKLSGSNTQHDRRIVQPREADGGDSSETGSQSAGLCPA